jgi:hypothetical protein
MEVQVDARRLARCLVVTFVAAMLMLAPIAAFAQYPGGSNSPSPTVGGEHFGRGGLTKTGSDVMLYVIIALMAVVAGLVLRRITRTSAARGDD